MRCLLCLLFGCGAASSVAGVETSTVTVELPHTKAHHAEIPLEAGHLLLGSDGAEADRITYALSANAGQLALFACDRMTAETGVSGFPLGEVEYLERDGKELLVGEMERSKLERLVSEPLPRIQTCEEELEISLHQVTLLRAFLEGRPPEQLDLTSISVVGLDMSFAISHREPDQVRLELRVDRAALEEVRQQEAAEAAEATEATDSEEEPEPLEPLPEPQVGDRCPLKVGLDEEQETIARIEFVAAARHNPAHFEGRMPRPTLTEIAARPSIVLDVCGAPVQLDSVVLQTLRTFLSQ